MIARKKTPMPITRLQVEILLGLVVREIEFIERSSCPEDDAEQLVDLKELRCLLRGQRNADA